MDRFPIRWIQQLLMRGNMNNEDIENEDSGSDEGQQAPMQNFVNPQVTVPRQQYRAYIDASYLKQQRDAHNELRRFRVLRRRRSFISRVVQNQRKTSFVTNQDDKVRGGGETGAVQQYLIPNTAEEIARMDFEAYNTVFNGDGTKLLVTSRNGLTVIDRVDSHMSVQHVTPQHISWAITDSDLSHDGRLLVHCSLHPYVSIYDINAGEYRERFNLASNADEDESPNWYSVLRLFSVKFNHDASQILASSSGHGRNRAFLKVFDVNLKVLSKTIPAHDEDINTITYVDRKNSHIFVSGSDDCRVKIWDMRALGIHDRPVGYFLGHVAGVTSVASREDGLYVASNGKDQLLKLWDLRKMEDSCTNKPFRPVYFDYRYQMLQETTLEQIRKFTPQQNFDNSIASYYGHRVMRTLIRCHFSPALTTDRRYLYSASACGKVFIYDIVNNARAAVLDYRDTDIVRDCVWHPLENKLLVADWEGRIIEWRHTPIQCGDFEILPRAAEQQMKEEGEDDSENREQGDDEEDVEEVAYSDNDMQEEEEEDQESESYQQDGLEDDSEDSSFKPSQKDTSGGGGGGEESKQEKSEADSRNDEDESSQ